MVRLVFRPYTQVWRTICTSVSLRTSTRVSLALSYPSIVHHLSGPIMHTFTLTLFGRTSGQVGGAAVTKFRITTSHLVFHFRFASVSSTLFGFKHQNARVHVRLLGPCFKTGRLNLFCWQSLFFYESLLNFRWPDPRVTQPKHGVSPVPLQKPAKDANEVAPRVGPSQEIQHGMRWWRDWRL